MKTNAGRSAIGSHTSPPATARPGRMNSFQHAKTKSEEMFIQAFRKASRGLGEYCDTGNELRIRRGRKVYLFACGKCELRFTAPGRAEVAFQLAADATVPELRRCFDWLIEAP